MRSHLITSALTIALGLATPIALTIGCPEITVAQTVDQRKVEADRLLIQGIEQSEISQYEAAIRSFQQALILYRTSPFHDSEASVLWRIGIAYNSLLQYEKAIAYYEQARVIFQQTKNYHSEASALLSLGSVYHSLWQYEKEISCYKQALPIFQQIEDQHSEAGVLMRLGNIYDSLSQYEKAIAYYEQARPIFQQANNPFGRAEVLVALGSVYYSLSQYEKAITYYEQALPIYQQFNARGGKADVLMNLGRVYYSLSQYEKAITYYEQALPIYQQFTDLIDRNSEAIVLMNLGLVYYSSSQYEKAIAYYEKALPMVKRRGTEASLFHNFGALFAQRSEPEVAILFYKQSVNVRETIRQDIRQLPQDSRDSYTQSVAGTYRSLADLLLSQGRIGEAQKVLELLKVQELNDITEGSRSPSPQQNQVALSKLEEQIIQKHTSLIQFGQLLSECKRDTCAKIEEYKITHRQLTEAYDKFIEDLKTQLVADRDKSIAATTDDFTSGASKIVNTQPNTVLIYPLVLKDKTRILWASQGGILSQAECPLGEADLSKLIKQFRDDLQNNSDLNPVQKTGQKLYECLLPKTLRNELTKNKIDNLVFVPDRITNYIPMAALYDGKNYLIETFTVSNILSVGLTDTKDKLPDRPSVLGFGLSNSVTLSNPTRNFGSLPFVPIELAAIVQSPTSKAKNPGIFPGTTWLDRDFSRNNLETKLLSQKPNILHIATHGEFVASSPKTSYLVLGDGTPYPMSEIQYLDDLQNVHLVVLSACETALGGSDSNGLEVAGIASYFLSSNAKAKAVLASLWKVNDPATSILMSQFYASLATDRLPKAQALRKVQRDLITSKLTLQDAANRAGARLYEPDKKRPQNLSHPYYWAPFILIGNSL
jgi:CHAT domain-containing protein/uncharacterized protein HemY